MPLILRIKLGPLEGKTFKINDGDIIGRTTDSAISIPDTKISTKHAQISKDQQGEFVITDLGSTNGLRLKGKKVAQVTLSPGVELLLGNTVLECLIESDTLPKIPAPRKIESLPQANEASKIKLREAAKAAVLDAVKTKSKSTSAPTEHEPTASFAIDLVPQTWNEYLADFTRQSLMEVNNTPTTLKPFTPNLVLTFIRGPQIGTEWLIGYGPRHISSDASDYRVINLTGPEPAFRLTPHGHLAQIENHSSDLIKLNGKTFSSDVLKDGDILIAGEAHLRVGYRE